MTLESEVDGPRGNLPEFRVYQRGRFVPQRLNVEFPIFMYSRVSCSGKEDVFFQVKRVLSQDDERICFVSAVRVNGFWPSSPIRNGHSFTLEVSKKKNEFWVIQSVGIEDNFFGYLWVLGKNEIRRVTNQRSSLCFGSEIALLPVLFDDLGREQGVIVAEVKDILPGSLGNEFLGEFVKGLVALPIKSEKRDLPAVYANSDETRRRSRGDIKPVRWVRLGKPESFYTGRRQSRRR